MKREQPEQPTINFLRHFKGLFDPRQARKVQYPLDEVLLLVLCAVISGADSWVEVATWGKKKLDFLRRFLPYANGTPSHDQLGIIFAVLDATQFQQCFIDWVSSCSFRIKKPTTSPTPPLANMKPWTTIMGGLKHGA